MTATEQPLRSAVPHDPDVERAVLGAVLNHPYIARDVLAVAHPATFWTPAYRAAMEAVASLVTRGVPPEPLIVAGELDAEVSLTVADLVAMTIDAPSDGGALHCAHVVARRAVERSALAESEELRRAVDDGTLAEKLPALLERLRGLTGPLGAAGWDRYGRIGSDFVLDSSADLEPVWGSGDSIVWAAGEPLLMCGPTGVGKTTLALQLVAGQLGIVDTVLGWPVKPASRLLYLALDRPLQIKRAMRRLFDEQHRDVLEERLVVWQGPLPADLGKEPEMLLRLCEHYGADAVWIDSLKDAAVKLTDDEAGGNLNRAVQHAVAAGIEVAALHHQRKGQNGAKPSTLEDVYGSTWITAGAGSVVLLWGAAGDPLVELRHLKQPAAEIGPLRIEHDHLTGLSSIYRGVADPLIILRNRTDGIDATALARLMFECEAPGDTQRKKAERALDRLVRDGLAYRSDPHRAPDGTYLGRRYYAVTDRHESAEI